MASQKTKKKYVTVTGKNGGKIKTTVGSNTYNTLLKNGGKVTSGSSSGGSSSAKDYTLRAGESVAQWNARVGGNASVVGPNADGTLGLTSAQVSQLNTMPGIDQNLLSNYKATLPKATAPTTPTAINQMSPVTVPTADPTVVNPANAISVSSGLQTYMDAIQKQLEQQQARADKLAKENQSLMEKTLGTMKNPEDVYDQAWEDTGMSAKEYFASQEAGIKEIDSLNQQYATVQGAMEQQIAQSNDKMASMNFINNQTAQIRRNAEPQLNTISAKISSKAATLQALQGNFAEARSLVRDAVDAATAGNKFKYDMYSALYEQNIDNFNRVDKSYSEAFSNAMDLALKDYEMQREEKMQIGELMLKYPSAGIDMNGTLSEAFERAGLVAGEETGGGVDLTADMKNYEYAVAGGYTGTFAEWLGKNGSSGNLPKEVFSLGTSDDPNAAQEIYTKLEQLGLTSSDIIQIQNELNAGKTLKEIAEESGMPNSLYLELQNNYITKFGE